MIRIPYPIPEPDRTWLILAGKEACRQNHRQRAREHVEEIIDGIINKYGRDQQQYEAGIPHMWSVQTVLEFGCIGSRLAEIEYEEESPSRVRIVGVWVTFADNGVCDITAFLDDDTLDEVFRLAEQDMVEHRAEMDEMIAEGDR